MVNFRELEERVLQCWEREQTFEKSLELRRDAERFVFYEGPPTANGRPGIHHVLARVYKDVICRYKTMRGYLVERKAGWDTHGLPVELEVEKELGLGSKRDIERYGIAAFNRKCRESVWRYKEEWEKLTRRMGFWLDMARPYITYDWRYMESLWWIIRRIWEKKDKGGQPFLYRDHKVVPYCPRCGTGLSSHEVAQGYQEVTETSLYVKFKLKPGQRIGNFETDDHTYILSWTTTPWTLPGNVALAVGAAVEYVILARSREFWILAREAYERLSEDHPAWFGSQAGISVPGAGIPKVKPSQYVKGEALLGLHYEPLFDISALQNERSQQIYPADFVTTTEGTGVVHTAVMYGEEDYALGATVGLPRHHTVDEEGKFTAEVPGLSGLPVKDGDTEQKILGHLRDKNFLFRTEPYTHDYPFCWRCDSPLLYYAKPSWFVRMSALREQLVRHNAAVTWVPAHLREGRFGEWLREVKDWAFSRERYWGTPLPVWRCERCAQYHCVGSVKELDERAWRKSGNAYHLMRHGEATSNVSRRISCSFEEDQKNPAHLTEKGKREVLEAALRLKDMGITVIVSSDFTRARETAEVVARETGAAVVYDERLRELAHGESLHGKSVDEYLRAFQAQGINRFTRALAGGETLNAVRGRMMAALRELEERYADTKILIVSHGDPLWQLECALLRLTDEDDMLRRRETSYPAPAEVRPARFQILPYDEEGFLNLHRPYIDAVFLRCECGGKMVRIKELVDVWFDSGAMPFAQWHYMGLAGTPLEQNFPADYIAEAVDQTRGWFYTLLAVSTLLERGAPYRNVISLAHVLDKDGKKMSKSRGRAVNPWEMIEKYGIDAVRWYFFTVNDAGDPKLFDEAQITERLRGFLGTFWNCAAFYKTYCASRTEDSGSKAQGAAHVLDRWVLSRMSQLIGDVRAALDTYDITGAGRHIERFVVDDLSQWYLRRSRERLQEYPEAVGIFRRVLETVAKLSAPFIPFVADAVWREIGNDASVHLADFPAAGTFDEKLLGAMRTLREDAVREVLAMRAREGIKVRQPLRLFVTSIRTTAAVRALPPDVQEALGKVAGEEANMEKVEFGEGETGSLDTVLDEHLETRGAARDLARRIQDARKKAGLKPGEPITIVYGDAEREILEHPLYGIEVKARTVIAHATYRKGAPLVVERA